MTTRTADPYGDTDVIDALAPRYSQAFMGTLSLTAILTGWWPIFGLLALQLLIGLTVGRRFCLPCWFYFEVVQPRRGEGKVEDSRPPRFANMIGFTVLASATVAHIAGAATLGNTLGGLVAALALLAAATGLCVGCELYRLGAKLRGIRPGSNTSIDLVEIGGAPTDGVVVFTHPLCSECQELEHRLATQGDSTFVVDVSKRPELARRYGIAVVPRAFRVDATGRVLAHIA